MGARDARGNASRRLSVQPLDATSYAICGKKLELTLPSKSVVMLRLIPR